MTNRSEWKRDNGVTTRPTRDPQRPWAAYHAGKKMAGWQEKGFVEYERAGFSHESLERSGWLVFGEDEEDACRKLQEMNPHRLTPLP